MNGALYPQPQGALMDPRQAMIMQMGLGLMAGSGPSRTPVSFGQTMGQAGMQGMNAYNQTNQSNQQQQLFQMKLAEVQREAAERKKKEEALAALMKDPKLAGMGPLLQVSPQTAIDRAFPKDNRPMVVSPGASLVDPENPAKPLYTAPRADAGPASDLGKLAADLKAGIISQADHDAKVKKLSTHSPLVNVDTRQASKFSEAVGKEMGDQYAGLLRADMNAPVTIGKYQQLGNLLGQVNTGKFKGTTVQLKAAAKSLGVDLTAMGVADDVAPAQAAMALSNQLALELRNPAGGAGMPGAMSDQDRNFLVQMVPSLESDPGAWPKMIEYRVALAKREQQVAKMARAYRKRNNGEFDEGFFDELAEWSAKNHMFKAEDAKPAPKPAAPTAPTGLSPAEQKELEDLRKRLGR